MGFFKSKKGSIISDYFLLLEDVGQLKAGNMIEVALYDENLELSAPMSPTPISLSYSQVTDIYYGTETEIRDKNKSVIGRALVGGLLFAGAGAVVGAVSGLGTKQEKIRKTLLIISYKSSNGEDDRFLKFEDTRHHNGAKLYSKLKCLCNVSDVQITSL